MPTDKMSPTSVANDAQVYLLIVALSAFRNCFWIVFDIQSTLDNSTNYIKDSCMGYNIVALVH